MDMRIWKWGLGVSMVYGLLLGGATEAMAEVSVTDVTAAPWYPWNGLVDISCTVSGMTEGGAGGEFEVAAVDGETGSVREVSHFHVAGAEDKEAPGNGTYELVWDARADLGEVVVGKMVVRVTVREKEEDPHGGGQLWAGGPYWADRNLGADHPWESGRYFWWGDTVGSLPGGFSFYSESTPTWGKYPDELRSEGWITATGVLAPKHDAAHVQWGGTWRMPTEQELQDLCDKCDWTWTTLNGVNGCVVRGRGAYASASIFLPAAGYGWETSLGLAGYGVYWSSVPNSSSYETRHLYSWVLSFRSGYHGMGSAFHRCYGPSVRPVRGSAE